MVLVLNPVPFAPHPTPGTSGHVWRQLLIVTTCVCGGVATDI